MFNLWLMRHGIAVDPDQSPSDAQRTLTPEGRSQVASLGRWLKERGAVPQLVLHSPLVRATETGRLMALELGVDQPPQSTEVLSPGMTAQRLLASLSQHRGGTILCVGHQPDIGRCVQTLVGGGQFQIAPAFCASISFHGPAQCGNGAVEWITLPDWFA